MAKSDIVKTIAKNNKLKLIDIRLSQTDSVDLNGFPKLDGEKATYVPMDIFPIESTEIPQGFNGWLIFFDEINSAPLSIQSAAYKIILDKQVGQHNLHKNVAMVAAGNLSTDKAVVNRMSTALQSRLIHYELHIQPKHWIEWADANDIDYRIKSYLNFKPDMLHNFDPNHNDYTYSCPRTWEFSSKLIKGKDLTEDTLIMLAGTLGEGVAREFYSYTKIYKSLPKLANILNDPTGTNVPIEPANQYALSGLLGHVMDKVNVGQLIQYIVRLPIEFQIITVQAAIARDKVLINNPVINDWKVNNVAHFL